MTDLLDHDTRMAVFKVLFAWALTAAGAVTLQNISIVAALVYTLLQIYVLVRDKFVRRGDHRD